MARRNSGRRIILVVTDGDTEQYSTVDAIEKAEKAGIEVYCLGIETAYVGSLARPGHWAVARTASQLPDVMADQLARAIKACAFTD